MFLSATDKVEKCKLPNKNQLAIGIPVFPMRHNQAIGFTAIRVLNVFDSFENVTVRALPRRISKISVDLLWEELVEAKKGSDSEEVLSITQYIFSRAKKDGLLSCILQIAERYISECDSLCLTGGVFDCSDIFYKYEVTQKDIKMLDFPGPSDEKDLTVL